jgi:hypothetical protein
MDSTDPSEFEAKLTELPNEHNDSQHPDQGSVAWRSEETSLGKLLCCAEDVGRRSQSLSQKEFIRIESESLVRWAEDHGKLVNWEKFRLLTPSCEDLPGGAEHQVWAHNDGFYHRVFKVTRPPNYGARGRLLSYVQNALWCNYLFGDDIQLEGVCQFPEGLAVIISQPYIIGRPPTPAEIVEWCELGGYERKNDLLWIHPETGVRIADTHEGNFKVLASGVMVPIDLQVLSLGTA